MYELKSIFRSHEPNYSRYVEEAVWYKKERRPVWIKWAASASCLVLVCAAGIAAAD